MLTGQTKGGGRVREMLTTADKGGRGVRTPLFFADIICEGKKLNREALLITNPPSTSSTTLSFVPKSK